MDSELIAAELREKATNADLRSQSARLRDVFDDIEVAINAGVPLSSILATLHAHGFSMSLGVFKTTLYRLRNRKQKGTKLSKKPPIEIQPTIESNERPEEQTLGQVLDKSTREAKASKYIGIENPLVNRARGKK